MCFIVRYVDCNWKLQKRLSDFCGLAPPHTGHAIVNAILQCLSDWGMMIRSVRFLWITLQQEIRSFQTFALNGKL